MISAFSQRWHEIEPLIDRLFDVPVAERTEWLRSHCADVTLRALVVQALDNATGIEVESGDATINDDNFTDNLRPDTIHCRFI